METGIILLVETESGPQLRCGDRSLSQWLDLSPGWATRSCHQIPPLSQELCERETLQADHIRKGIQGLNVPSASKPGTCLPPFQLLWLSQRAPHTAHGPGGFSGEQFIPHALYEDPMRQTETWGLSYMYFLCFLTFFLLKSVIHLITVFLFFISWLMM